MADPACNALPPAPPAPATSAPLADPLPLTPALVIADARHLPFSSESVQCCVTSPPYWGLRDYGTAKWEGGDADCTHLAPMPGGFAASGLAHYDNGLTAASVASKVTKVQQQYRDLCGTCGARRIDTQLGLESSPDAYVAALVDVCREVRRVLRPDGTLWLNLGDSYVGGGGFCAGAPSSATSKSGKYGTSGGLKPGGLKAQGSLKAKDLVGIPWRVAFALQSDGWYLRSDIIWAKPNPMPESVSDRPTRSHEYVFLLSKAPRYYYDIDAIRNPLAASTLKEVAEGYDGTGTKDYAAAGVQNPSSVKARIIAGKQTTPKGSNARSVWTITPQVYRGAHFATMPEALVEKCIRAGSRPGDTVLDPFLGSGTVVAVAKRLARRGIGCDIQRAYVPLQKARVVAA